MFNSLYSKIASALAGLFFVVGVLFIGITVFSTDMYQQEVNQKLNTNLAKQIVKERLLMAGGRVNNDALKEIFHMLMVVNPAIEIYLLNTKGQILTFSAPDGSVKLKKVDLEPIRQYLNQKLTSPLLGDDPKRLKRKKVFSAARIEKDGKHEGYLYVILGGEQYDSAVQKIKGSYILQLSAAMIIAGLLFALVAGLMLFALLTGRLKQLARVMDAFRLEETIKATALPVSKIGRTSDEIDRLRSTFENMALRIDSQVAELKTSEKIRRELVANVSHDLRTPLATLQGYIETLLIKENQYTTQERREYLEVAIKHCRRLNKLVSGLLELAKLESVQMEIQAEAFNLGELTQDIVQGFTLTAEQKKIQLKTRFDENLDFVLADIALIERAMENLIENALHHTPENGCVTVEIGQTDTAVITISDTGSGISEKELPSIFKRFYHSDRAGNKKDGQSGLGLAITQKIIELHGHRIQVSTKPGKGSCFSFSLPTASLQ